MTGTYKIAGVHVWSYAKPTRVSEMLGSTYDGQWLAERGVEGVAPNPAEARAFYEKALAKGVTGAAEHLRRLAPTR